MLTRGPCCAEPREAHAETVPVSKRTAPQVQEKVAAADIMLMPSELESFGLAALEAMACEVVPIATRAGGVPEVIDHGKSGFLADVGDVETMAGYAIKLLQDDALLKEMGRQGRAVGPRTQH